jgi:hypothetical protein
MAPVEIATRKVFADVEDGRGETLVAVPGEPINPVYREYVPDDAVVTSQQEYDRQYGTLAQPQPNADDQAVHADVVADDAPTDEPAATADATAETVDAPEPAATDAPPAKKRTAKK